MVSETFQPARKEKEKQQAQQSYKKKEQKYSLQYKLKTQNRDGVHTA